MPDPGPKLTRAQRQRLLTTLAELSIFQTYEGRTLLLADLPSALVQGVGRSTTTSVDLEALVRAGEAWGTLDDGTPALHVLVENALFHGRGGSPGRDLEALYAELTAPAAPSSPSRAVLPPPVSPTDLTPADPATVLLISHPQDSGPAEELAAAWALRGLRVRYSRYNDPLPIGWGLATLVTRCCDAVVFYVGQAGWENIGWWEPAAQAALARQSTEATFAVIPLLPVGVAQKHAQAAVALFTPLYPLLWHSPMREDWRTLHTRVLQGALTGRLARVQDAANGLVLSFHTFPYSAAGDVLHLDCDWTALFTTADPGPAAWRTQLQPALDDVYAVLARRRHPAPVTIWLKARLEAVAALGYRFPPKGSIPVRWASPTGMILSSDGPRPPADDLHITRTLLNEEMRERAVLIEIAVTREVPPIVDAWLERAAVRPRWRLTAAPVDGSSRQAITSSEQARAWAWRIGDMLRDLWDHGEADAVWFFVAGSVEFTGLLGQQLYSDSAAQHPIQVYTFRDKMYRLACTLGHA